jgi:glycosyltransferase involved in cell wall biosynthesis
MIIFQLIQKPQLRGAEVFASQLSSHLEKLGQKVFLISVFYADNKLDFLGDQILLNRPLSRRFVDIIGWYQLAKLIELHKPDIIQCNAGDTMKFAMLSKTLFGWNVAVVVRNASLVGSYITGKSTKIFNKYLYQRIDKIICVSHSSKKNLNSVFPQTAHKSVVIPIGIESYVFTNSKWQRDNKSIKNIVHVGGFTFEKNHYGVLRIFNRTLLKNKNVHLHLFGDGPKMEEIKKCVKEYNLVDSVSFYGFVKNPIDYIKSADILILPSLIEGLPGVILEAQFCKTPVVAYNVGGISEVLKNGSTGYLIDKGDEDGFSEAINQVLNLENEIKILEMTNLAYEQVLSEFDNRVIANRFLDEYKKILASVN